MCFSKAMDNYIPASTVQKYSILLNSGLCWGIFFSNFLGLLVPVEDADDPSSYQALKDDENWRVVYGFCGIAQFFVVISVIFFFPVIDLLSIV